MVCASSFSKPSIFLDVDLPKNHFFPKRYKISPVLARSLHLMRILQPFHAPRNLKHSINNNNNNRLKSFISPAAYFLVMSVRACKVSQWCSRTFSEQRGGLRQRSLKAFKRAMCLCGSDLVGIIKHTR